MRRNSRLYLNEQGQCSMSKPCIHYNLGVRVIKFYTNKPYHILNVLNLTKNECIVRAVCMFPGLMFNILSILLKEISTKKKISRSPDGLILKR